MLTPEINFRKCLNFERKLKNFRTFNFFESQKTTRATFLKCGTP